jgi:hypothetical protein
MTKFYLAKTAAKISILPLANKHSTLKKVSTTNLPDAQDAVKHGKLPAAETVATEVKLVVVKCSLLFAPSAAKRLRSLSNQLAHVQFTAVSASTNKNS